MDRALEILNQHPPHVFNHNMETAPRLYTKARPGANYQWSLDLLKKFGEANPDVPTKSGLMVGLGETNEEILEVMARFTCSWRNYADNWPILAAK